MGPNQQAPETGKSKPESISLDVTKMDMGLSRWLRYSYGGFLLVLLLVVFDQKDFLEAVIGTLKVPLAFIAVVVVGAAVYTLHRRFIIPVHHLLGIWLHRTLWERNCSKQDSMNPVVWLLSLKVREHWGIIAYSYLRKTNVFEKRDDLNVEHAELGLLVMTAVALMVAGVGVMLDSHIASGVGLILLGAALFATSTIPAMVLHAAECLELRTKEEAVKDELKKVGLIK